jgi:hypothetical protein
MFSGAAAIRRSLQVLGEKVSRAGREPICVMVCGGSALNLSGLITRTTEDVDELGIESGVRELEPLPEWLLRCAEEVGVELGLEEDWFNDAASVLKNLGYPAGLMERAKRERFGDGFEVAIASRMDLIAMKCLAALDPKSGRKHLEDLVDLAPSGEEVLFAQSWLFARPTSPQFRQAFERLCAVLGHKINVTDQGAA